MIEKWLDKLVSVVFPIRDEDIAKQWLHLRLHIHLSVGLSERWDGSLWLLGFTERNIKSVNSINCNALPEHYVSIEKHIKKIKLVLELSPAAPHMFWWINPSSSCLTRNRWGEMVNRCRCFCLCLRPWKGDWQKHGWSRRARWPCAVDFVLFLSKP